MVDINFFLSFQEIAF